MDLTVYTTGAGSATCTACFTYVEFARYSVTFLGAGFDSSRTVDVNDSGSVVGKVWSATNGWTGRLWTSVGAAVDLGVFLPVALNNGGSVVGNGLWENGAVRTLPGQPSDINDRGDVALIVNGGAYLWRNDSLTALSSDVNGLGRMNRWGEVAAQRFDRTFDRFYACVLSTGAMRDLGAGNYSYAIAVNDAGWVIAFGGGSGVPIGGYLFSLSGSRGSELPFIPAAINNSLQVVGYGSIWQDGATASLTTLVLDSTWTVSDASAINERGQITAYGVNVVTGARGAIRLDPVASAPGSPAKRRR